MEIFASDNGEESVWQAIKKNLADISLYMLAEGWVISHYVSLSGFTLMGAGCADVLQFTGMSASSHSISYSGIALANSLQLHESGERQSASIHGSCFFIADEWFKCLWT